MKDDYSEKVIELLCEKIDRLEKENKELKERLIIPSIHSTPTLDNSNPYLTTNPTVTHTILCMICRSFPCRCTFRYSRGTCTTG
jgi:hypothetical protein